MPSRQCTGECSAHMAASRSSIASNCPARLRHSGAAKAGDEASRQTQAKSGKGWPVRGGGTPGCRNARFEPTPTGVVQGGSCSVGAPGIDGESVMWKAHALLPWPGCPPSPDDSYALGRGGGVAAPWRNIWLACVGTVRTSATGRACLYGQGISCRELSGAALRGKEGPPRRETLFDACERRC